MKLTKKMRNALLEISQLNNNGSCLIEFCFGEYEFENVLNALNNIKIFWDKVMTNKNCFLQKYFCGIIKIFDFIENENLYTIKLLVFATIKQNKQLNIGFIKAKISNYFVRTLLITKTNSDFFVNIKYIDPNNYINQLTENKIRNSANEELKNLLFNKKLITFHGCYHICFDKLRNKRNNKNG